MNHPLTTTVSGYPRIGPDREWKRAVEAYWAGRLDEAALRTAADDVTRGMVADMRDAGLDSVPVNVFSMYDHVLDAAVMVDAVPHRFRALGRSPVETYFALARGTETLAPLELTKWFDTNYHYLVPELEPGTRFRAVADKPVHEFALARAAGVEDARPVLLGPVTFLLLAKPGVDAPADWDRLELLDGLVDCYVEVLSTLAEAGAAWVQLDEPAFNLDRSEADLAALRRAYDRLTAAPNLPRLFVTGGYGEFGDALPTLLESGVDALGLDLCSGRADLDRLEAHGPVGDTVIVAGLVDGRNVWINDRRESVELLRRVRAVASTTGVSTSCSLLHVPIDAAVETGLDAELSSRLAFARQKLAEVEWLGQTDHDGRTPAPPGVPDRWRDEDVRARLAALDGFAATRTPYEQRTAAQRERFGLPVLPTTTIGSFPQTAEIRAARAGYRSGRLTEDDYRARMRAEIENVVAAQKRLGLDVLVHGEPERNDMVQYFAEALDGFAATRLGWVQSYGSRCVRPPILYADVARRRPITVEWSRYAQSLTDKPVKGMLTGPVTILAWSFVREDQPLADTARQVALALRDEVGDLEAAGIGVIQVDEPALRELLPPRRADHAAYLEWAAAAFRLATGGVADDTQVHTHLCYSEFGEVIDAIGALDADVTSIEASRSRMEVVNDLRRAGYRRGVGPGVYDIHSPRVPTVNEITTALRAALAAVPPGRLWVNPDCGLKTRAWAEVEPSLAAMVAAAARVRSELDD